MTEILTLAYPWLKAAHLIFVIFWMAGLFMLPRFFVYHQEADAGSPEAARWVEREDKLATIIMNPSMLIVWLLGLTLGYYLNLWAQPWFIVKLVCVVGLSGYQGWLMGYRKKLVRGEQTVSGRTLRLLNEIPGIAVAVIVVLVIVRPLS
jgi:putative membrane protein